MSIPFLFLIDMKDFKNWGIRIRRDLSKNYYSVWENLVTTRLDMGEPVPLEPECSEFYDVGITERCNACCNFCYVEAGSQKKDYNNICESWKKFIGTFPEDRKVVIQEDPVFQDIISKPESGVNAEELAFKLKTVLMLKYGAWYTHKPFQIAIGE